MSVTIAEPLVDTIAELLCARRGLVWAGLAAAERDEWRDLAEPIAEWVRGDDFHEGCVSAEMALDEDDVVDGFNQARARILDGILRLSQASMIEAEAAVELVPRIREMEYDPEWVDPEG